MSRQDIVIIGAMGHNRVIGDGDGMPWDVPDEYQHFLNTTRDQIIIIGRRSYEIFGPTLECHTCYVVTHSNRTFGEALTASSLSAAIQQARQQSGRTIFIAGGASIYDQAIPLADSMQLSYISGQFDGDRYFPDFDTTEWTIARDEVRDHYRFVEYVRSATSAMSPDAP